MRHILKIAAHILMIPILSWTFASCVDRLETIDNASVKRETASLSLSLSVRDLLDGTPETKGTFVGDAEESSEIKNLWILQYDGTEPTDTLLFCHYYDDYEAIKDKAINVIASGNKDNSLFFIANTFNPSISFGSAKTIAQARSTFIRITKDLDAVHSEGSVSYPMMNGRVVDKVSTGTVSCSLERSVARVDCNVKCNVSGMTVQNITLCNVPGQEYCLTKDYVGTLSTFPDEVGMSVIDYEPTPWNDGKQKAGDADTRQFTFYIPCNKRGTTTNTNPKLKSASAPSNSTYARITASYNDDGVTRYVTYSFYLGANLTNDFNLLPNHRYTYSFIIDKIGDQDTDFRVSLDYVDFRKRNPANCYMIEPPSNGTWKSYLIPIKRVNEFWNDYAGDELKSLGQTGCPGWAMEIIWSDTPLKVASQDQSRSDVPDCNFKWKVQRKKFHGDDSVEPRIEVNKDFFEFEIPSSVNNANILIGIRRYSDNTCTTLDEGYLWSWHLWITDYEPSKCVGFTPQIDSNGDETRFVYSVPGGAVHRYLGNLWSNNQASVKTGVYKGIYKDKFIMDRNLGARQVNVSTVGDELYYQFGRKDPFCNSRTQYNVGAERKNISSDKTEGANNNVDYSVIWPNAFITGGDWSKGAKTSVTGVSSTYNQVTPAIYWQDPKATEVTLKKSIFDPCPEGWRVPFNGTWNDFNVSASTRFKWGDPIPLGRTYLPSGITGTIYFPASGHLNSGSGGSYGVGSYGTYWSCSPLNASSACDLNFYSGGVNPSNGNDRAYGFPVRCVQE